MDVAIRLLLIPSKHITTISGIDLKNINNYNKLHYKTLAKTFASSFYKKASQKLEERLNILLTPEIYKQNKSRVIINNDINLQPKHIVDLLLEKQSVPNKSGKGSYLRLINLNVENKGIIYKFYEFR